MGHEPGEGNRKIIGAKAEGDPTAQGTTKADVAFSNVPGPPLRETLPWSERPSSTARERLDQKAGGNKPPTIDFLETRSGQKADHQRRAHARICAPTLVVRDGKQEGRKVLKAKGLNKQNRRHGEQTRAAL